MLLELQNLRINKGWKEGRMERLHGFHTWKKTQKVEKKLKDNT